MLMPLLAETLPPPSKVLNFTQATLPAEVTYARSGNRWTRGADGLWFQSGANICPLGYTDAGAPFGRWFEPTATNYALYCRDLTNGAWSPTNCNRAKTATGIDGVANSATTLTATADNATLIQSITKASALCVTSAFVRRRTGTGSIFMTTNNGSTWTEIVPTSSWQRFYVAPSTQTNPAIGFKLATSGDAIDVDFAQHENGAYPTSPMLTTGTAAGRSLDNGTLASLGSWFNPVEGTILVVAAHPYPTLVAGSDRAFCLGDGTSANRIDIGINGPTNAEMFGYATRSSSTQFDLYAGGNIAANVLRGAVLRYSQNNAQFGNGGSVSGVDVSCLIPTVNQGYLGRRNSTTANIWGGVLAYVAFWTQPLPEGALVALGAQGGFSA